MLPNPDSHPAKRPNTLLPSQEGLQREAAEKRPRARIETLADLIFGLSLSVGSVAAIASSPTTPAEIGSHILAFMFTFLLLITAWLIYTGFIDRKSTRLNSSHANISYAVFCLKKKTPA